MLRLWTFLPAIILCAGAIIAALGALWAAYRQSDFNAEIRAKNEEIIRLQQANINALKGSNVCHFIATYAPDSNGRFPLMSINGNEDPIYDVYLIITSHVDASLDTPKHQAEALHYMTNPERIEIGTLPPGAKQTNVFLEPGYYQIDIRTRYNKLTQFLRFGPFKSGFGQSYIVSDLKGNISAKNTSPDGYPKVY
jgi:hypothetical protein